MNFFKQNPAFCSFCLAALLVFVVSSALLMVESGKLSESREKVIELENRLNALMYAEPAPTAQNVVVAKKNLDELNARLFSVFKDLRSGSSLVISTDPARVVSGIQRYIINYQRHAEDHKDRYDVPAPIRIPEDFAFGFEKYLGASILPEGSTVLKLDKQRQVLGYVLDQLIASDPFAIQSVEREIVENEKIGEGDFRIDPAVSARVSGVIDTLAFRVTFTGYTPTLRRFLNSLAEIQLPIVVRSVAVDRRKEDLKDDFDSLFSPTASIQSGREPVVSEAESIFTVTLEFIEVISSPGPEELAFLSLTQKNIER